MHPLPIDDSLPEILDLALTHRRLVLVAPPGSGKTTRVAPALARSGRLSPSAPRVVMLQPRRVAARASAARIAFENGWTLGREVGHQVRNETTIGPDCRVGVMTEGILTRRLLSDPFLEGIGAVLLDEFHERSLHTDLALALVREAIETVRDDLILIVMSATLDAGPIARFLGDAPIVRVAGRSFPVTIEYLDFPEKTPLPDRVVAGLTRSLASSSGDRGDLLVFLPGVEEIRRSARAVAPIADREGLVVLPLHGTLTSEEQDRAIRPSHQRKLILSTNVAETSLTIDGVTTVIDSGLARIARHDPARGLDRLDLCWISRASATQRSGRAGRTAPGRALRLWPERENRGRPEFDEPEVRRVDLASTALILKSWGHHDIGQFGWFETPPIESLDAALRLLDRLGAIDTSGRLTPLGRRLLSLPVHPRLARLIAASADAGRLDEGATLAALLSERDLIPPLDRGQPTVRHAGRGDSDLIVRLDLLEEARKGRFSHHLRDRGIDPIAARRIIETRDDLLRIGRRFPRSEPDPDEDLPLKLALLAYPDRVCRRREGDPTAAIMVGGRGVRLTPESIVKTSEFFLALDPRDTKRSGKREASVRIASAIDANWLAEFFPDSVRRERTVRFDPDRGRAVAFDSLIYLDLTLREETHGAVSAEEASLALSDWLAPRAELFLREDDAARLLLDRIDFLHEHIPGCDLPRFDGETLAEVIASATHNKRTLDEVRRASFSTLLRGRLTFAQARLLDTEAPETIEVPTGNRIRLAYEPGRAPVLAVRLQELFGLADTPRLALGRVPVLLHLLGPNYRPVQITDDLKSFWTSTYFQVRKDLRNRYPKHSWPEDPTTARPEAKGKSRNR